MQLINLIRKPNQSFSISLSGDFYKIEIKEAKGIMTASITRNDIVLISGFIIVAGALIIPFKYLENESGNFIITTENQECPHYTRFGIDQYMSYLTQEEVDSIREAIENATT
jgi:hypothetical protein